MDRKEHNKKVVLGIILITILIFFSLIGVTYYHYIHKGIKCVKYAIPGYLLPLFLISIGIVSGAMTYYAMSDRLESKEKIVKKNVDIILRFLNFDEKKVVEKLLEKNGTVLQSEITHLPHMSKVKSHRTLKKLSEKGIIQIESYGKTNTVMLVKEIREGLCKP